MSRHLNIKAFLWIVVPLSIILWIAILIIGGTEIKITLPALLDALNKFPTVITIDLAVWFIFVKWAWKWRIFQGWLVPFPVLAGTWRGEIISTWIDPKTGQKPEPIPFILVIRQTFLTIHCSIFTKESRSKSYAANIIMDPETDTKQFVYNYSNRPSATVRDRSELHDGTALFDIIGKKPSEMKGEYWTSRNTTGEIEVKFKTKELEEKFSG